jgi:serine/threonine protein kinase/Tol biopolymer transport system component
MTLERGTLLHKRYRIVEILGQGGMGSVYRAVDENLGVDVAVKENLFTTDEYARQFRLEAVILANLRHPNLPRVSDHFVVGEEGQYLVMDFIEGEDLRQRMERLGTISEEDAIQIGAAICDALTYLHSRKPPILHRDIKPGNVKITPEGHIYLVDFGLAKVVQGSQVTTTGARAMTPGYSPPEQYGTARTDPRTDIYSLGATLYAALTGVIPEDGLARAMDNAQLTPLRKRNPKVSRRLAAAIEKAMAVDPADRFQTAEEFKKALLGTKAKTQQLTGSYMVSPPPAEVKVADAEEAKVAKPESKGPYSGPLPPPPSVEAKPFVPPGKRKREEKRRSRRRWTIFFLVMLVGAVFGTTYLFPDLLPGAMRASLPFFIPQPATVTLTASVTPGVTPSPAATETLSSTSTSTATHRPPTATFAPTSTPAAIVTETLAVIPPGISTTTLTPSPTPQGGGYGQIAFASDRSGIPQIYLSDLSGQTLTAITSMPEGACMPSWAPDGSRLVFVSPCHGNLGIADFPPRGASLYIVNADGSNLTPLTTVPGGDFEPAWSPDGTRIAFTSLRDGNMQIYVLSLKDMTVSRLTNLGPGVEARQPAWSPDGKQIVFAVRRVGVYQIWVMSDSGEDAMQLVRRGQQFWDYLPAWSVDGKVILFSERGVDSPAPPWQMSIFYEQRETDQGTRLNFGVWAFEGVRFSPDGFWLVGEGREENNLDIYYMTVAGANRVRLTSDPADDFDPVWRPLTP